MTSRAKAFPGKPTNSASTPLRAAHLDGGAIGCNQCIHSHSGNALAFPSYQVSYQCMQKED